jgi:hypothetical protein
MMRSKRLAGTAVLLIGLGLGAASCADDGGYVAYGAYPYDGFYNDVFIGGDFDHRHHFRFHEHGRFDHDGFGHDRGGFHHHGFHGGFGQPRFFRGGGFGHGGGGFGHGGGGFHR